jgi:hypothetical protein
MLFSQGACIRRPKELFDFHLDKGTEVEVLCEGDSDSELSDSELSDWWNAEVIKSEKDGVVRIHFSNGADDDDEDIRVSDVPCRIRPRQKDE